MVVAVTTNNKRTLSATNWRRLQSQYDLSDKLLGEGSFGRVFLGTSTIDGTSVAIKIPKIEAIIDGDNDNAVENARENAWAAVRRGEQEVHILARLAAAVVDDDDDDGSAGASSSSSSSPYIMPPFLASFIVADKARNLPILITVMPRYPNGTLEDLIESIPFGGLDEDVVRIVAHQLLLAVAHLVKHGIVHRDIKPENLAVLLDPNQNLDKIVLIDFGTAKIFTTTTTKKNTNQQQQTTLLRTFCGSDFFRATEIGSQAMSYYGPSVDLYSCGKTLLVALYGFFTHRKTRALYLRQQQQAAATAAREATAPSARAMVVTPVADRRRRGATARRTGTTDNDDEPLLVWHTVWKLHEVYNPRVAPNPFVENILRLAEEKPTKRPSLAVALRLFHNTDNVGRRARDFATATAQQHQHS